MHVYREALALQGLPWGYDPAVGAGLVTSPATDVGGKPQQIFGVIFWFLAPGTVVRLFTFLAALTFPLWTLIACRLLAIPGGVEVWIVLLLVSPVWLYQTFNFYLLYGLVAFASASFLAPLVLASFLKFLDRSCFKTYGRFLLCLSVLFFLHVLGPVVVALSLAYLTLKHLPRERLWRVAILLAPLGAILANAFWFGPFLLGTRIPPVPWSAADFESHLTYTGWQRFWEDLWPYRFPIGVLLGFCIVHGFRELARSVGGRVASCFAIAAGFVIFLKLFGSFLPFFEKMQPIRFVLPALALIVFPLGVLSRQCCRKTGYGFWSDSCWLGGPSCSDRGFFCKARIDSSGAPA